MAGKEGFGRQGAFRAHKFGAKPTEVDGIRFDSKKEARRFEQLRLLEQSGEIRFFLRQVPIHLPGKTKLVIDFVIFWADETVTFEDVKGMLTEQYKTKKRQVEALYPFKIVET